MESTKQIVFLKNETIYKKILMYKNSSIDERIQPIWLPQIDAPMDYVKKKLNMEGVHYKMERVDPKSLNPLQKGVYKSKVDEFYKMIDENQPIEPAYISSENDICDGHHREYAMIKHPDVKEVMVFKVMLPTSDAIRILNKIQDKYKWEQELDSGNDKILTFTDDFGTTEDEVIPSQKDMLEYNEITKNPKTLTLYKNTTINPKSKTGDFLLLKQRPNFNKEYEIEFDNLLELTNEEISNHEIPSEFLAKKWYPEINLKEEAVNSALTYEVFLNRKVAEKAKQEEIDGIKYGDKFVQVIN